LFNLYLTNTELLLFDHKGTKSQRLEGKNFVALCLGDFVVKLLNGLLEVKCLPLREKQKNLHTEITEFLSESGSYRCQMGEKKPPRI